MKGASVMCLGGACVIVLLTTNQFAMGVACSLLVAAIVAEEWR